MGQKCALPLSSELILRWEWMNEWKCNDLKCVRKPTRCRLSLTHWTENIYIFHNFSPKKRNVKLQSAIIPLLYKTKPSSLRTAEGFSAMADRMVWPPSLSYDTDVQSMSKTYQFVTQFKGDISHAFKPAKKSLWLTPLCAEVQMCCYKMSC